VSAGADWSPARAAELYNIPDWSEGYFGINAEGHLVACPRRGSDGPGIDLHALALELKAMALPPPVLVRFTDILHDRVDALDGAFRRAMSERGYSGRFTAVYPIKVNQQARVVDEILAHGGDRVGLEAGSKPELMAVLALAARGSGMVICNGYKDREYIRLALLGLKLGHRAHVVIEKPSELDQVLEASRALGVRPLLGVRLRLASIGKGKWQNTGGERSKFGLTAHQVLALVERLRAEGLLDTLELMHFHLGSQLPNIHDIQQGLKEAARFYAELHRLGAPVRRVDVGGGLGIDYEGTGCRSFCSMNYSVQEYANNVVQALAEICADQDLPHPEILTESGRAMSAHHAMLITEVIDFTLAPGQDPPDSPPADAPPVLQNLWGALEGLSRRNAVETYHDAALWLSEAQTLFVHGLLGLEQRAWAEHAWLALCQRVRGVLSASSRGHRELLDDLQEKLADKYICNFSLFQSLPDAWAIDQVFPVVPLHRLDEAPTRRGVLHDLTCDSDGQLNLYVGPEGVDATLPLHPARPGEPYLLGVFLVGAYQEILGDMHNLFGDTHSVNVALTPDGGHRIVDPRYGETVADVLRYVRFDPEMLLAEYRQLARAARLDTATMQAHLDELRRELSGYTYLEE
jgi:arginine decarboxylase